ncbi:MAG TPA: DUF1552 domain-containing protein, partial [Polyangia bacterium]|nr:DUF1552 domain-containing protein [Polyangia bacterium]
DFVLSPILAPLEPVKDRIMVVDGLTLLCGDQSKFNVEQSQGGMVGWLTGNVQPGPANFVKGPSIDQVLAARLGAQKLYPSLIMAVRWGTGKAHAKLSAMDTCTFAGDPTGAPIPPRIDLKATWQQLFGAKVPSTNDGTWDRSMLDALDKRYVKLAQKLGAADRQRLEAHLQRLRDLERQVAVVAACSPPALPDLTGYNPAPLSSDDGALVDLATDMAIPAAGKAMMDMMVVAMACDMTAAGVLQWADSEAKYTLPWLSLPETHYFYENGGGFRPTELQKIYTWYSSQHAYLLQQLASVNLGDHSLLDETVVFFGSELQHPATHSKTDMPFLLAGGGGLRTGRWVHYLDAPPHNNLLVALLNLYGDPRTTFGDPRCCTGALTGLT